VSGRPYQETQIGWIFMGVMLPVTIYLILAYFFQWGNNPIGFWGFIIMIVMLVGLCLMFYRLQTTVSYRKIELRYGIGLITIKPSIQELLSAEVIKLPLWYGQGIRTTPKGMMYNIKGRQVVRLTYRKDSTTKTIMIGSAQPKKLKLEIIEKFEMNPALKL
jgi:hypothetical protein